MYAGGAGGAGAGAGPRCREWTPLATQQLRLRTLIQIVGYNIRPPEWCHVACSFYYTLHCTTMSAPFYTSERIPSPHPKWKELPSDLTQNMSSTNVVIRIWCHLLKDNNDEEKFPSDIIIQTWGVYFNGLRLIGANLAVDFTSDSFKTNTLVFQMHGGYFCSYKSLNLQVIPSENLYELNSVSSGSSKTSETQRIPIEANYLQNHRIIKESRSISPNKGSWRSDLEYSKSQSPVERGFKQNFAKMKQSSSLNIAQKRDHGRGSQIIDTNHIYEHSPENLDVKEFCDFSCDNSKTSREDLTRSQVDLSETAENFDLRNEEIPKCKYLCLNFLKSEIRPSYNSSKLQKLHLLQYSIKKRKEAVQEVKERIYMKSAMEKDDLQNDDNSDKVNLTKLKSRSQRSLFLPEEESDSDRSSRSSDKGKSPNKNRPNDNLPPNGPRLTLKLNDLLSYKTKPSPHQRSEHARLTKQLEILRFKKIILSDERDGKLANIRRLKEMHSKLYEENQDIGTELMQKYHSLSRRTEILKQTRHSTAALRELAARSHTALLERRNRLLSDLQSIFYVENIGETWKICGVPLPISGEEGTARSNHVSDSAAAGLAAQCCSIAAALLSQPLRYRILLMGSATKIVDHLTPNLPDPQIPLFARGGDPTLFRYATFLLNKCLAQLLWGCGQPVASVRPTLANIQRLLSCGLGRSCLDTSKLLGSCPGFVGAPPCPHSQSLRSLVASERGKHRQFNRFKDAVDGQSPSSVLGLRRHRQSRSVGSYQDEREMQNLDISTTSIMGSEPFLHEVKSRDEPLTKHPHILKTHNSDSEISRLSIEQAIKRTEAKVIFTLGEDTKLDLKTVKMSSDDVEVSSDVKMSIHDVKMSIEGINILMDDVKISIENSRTTSDLNTSMEAVSVENVRMSMDEMKMSIDNAKKSIDEANMSMADAKADQCEACIEDNVKTICTEINDYWKKDKNATDIAKHMVEIRQISMEDSGIRSCEGCIENVDGVCSEVMCSNQAVEDLIVIPSAEAMLDTGQNQQLYEAFGGFSGKE